MPTIQRAGATIAYTRTGTGPAALLIQGVGIVGDGWRPQVEALRGEFTLVSFDNRGIGGSTMSREPLSVEMLAADAIAVMDAEGVDRFHVVGHSLGGSIALEVALAAPSRVLSLALLCTFARGKDGTTLRPDLLALGLRSRIGTRTMRSRAFLRIVMPDAYLASIDRDALAAELASLFGHDLADQPHIVMKQLKALSQHDARSRLSSLRSMRTVVVSAEHDRIARVASGRALAAAIPGSRFVEMTGAGHGVPIQKAAEVNQLLREHWRTGQPHDATV